MNDNVWLVIVRDEEIPGYNVYLVRRSSALLARERVKEEYQAQGWGTPERLGAYRLPAFRGKQNALQLCKLLDLKPRTVPSTSSDNEFL